MTELPYINGKTIKTISTLESSGSIDEVRLTHSDGSVLIITGEYIKIRLETAQPTQRPVFRHVGWWEGELWLEDGDVPARARITARSVWPGE